MGLILIFTFLSGCGNPTGGGGEISPWVVKTVDSTGYVGQGCALALDSQGNPHISYIDYTSTHFLKYAKLNGTSWQIESILGAGSPARTSIAIDHNDNPCISCRDYNIGLEYLKWNGSAWNIETVDPNQDDVEWTSIKIDTSNNPNICYSNSSSFKFAKWNSSSSTWEITTIFSCIIGGGIIGTRQN